MSSYQLAIALLTGRPYAGSALRALQGDPERQRCFHGAIETVARQQDGPIRILEIGCWAGVSAVSWGAAAQSLGRQAHLTCVDFWKPYFDLNVDSAPVYRHMNAAADLDLVFRLFEHNLRSAGLWEHADIRRGEARAILPGLADRSFDIVYIDAGHRFEDVNADIIDARRLVRPGGLIAGDDLELASPIGREREHADLLASGQDFARLATDDIWYHPGVTEAVSRHFPSVFAWKGFWAVQIGSDGPVVPTIDVETQSLPSHVLDGLAAETVRDMGQVGRWRFFGVADRVVAAGTASVAAVVGSLDVESLVSAPDLVIGRSLEDLLPEVARIDAARPEAVPAPPELIGDYAAFNLVRAAGKYLALAKALGHVAIDASPEEIVRREGYGNAMVGEDLGSLLSQVHIVSSLRGMADMGGEIKGGLAEARSKLDQLIDAAPAEQQLLSGLEALRSSVARIEEWIGRADLHSRRVPVDEADDIRQRIQAVSDDSKAAVIALERAVLRLKDQSRDPS